MPLFALPLAASATSSHSRSSSLRKSRDYSVKMRKRKRDESSPPPTSSSKHEDHRNTLDPSMNPLSLTEEDIIQYRLAGLELNNLLPDVVGWPHAGLREGQKESTAKPERGPSLRLQHLGVLTTVLHRCLLKGDIRRATRAWGMLIRMQNSGQGMDLRGSGYWGIGAELLVRSLDCKTNPSYDCDPDSENDDNNDEKEYNEREIEKDLRDSSWGSNEGLQKARDYYERLILEYPFVKQFAGNINALDFWPAMVGCEIYGIQFEQRQALRELIKNEAADREHNESFYDEDESDPTEDEEDNYCGASQDWEEKRRQRKQERRWQGRRRIRETALAASEKLAAELDERMTSPPYSDSCEMLRLRAMLALYIGDLRVPQKPNAEECNDPRRVMRNEIDMVRDSKNVQRRFLYRERMADYEKGVERRSAEWKRAREIFVRLRKHGGDGLGGLSEDYLAQGHGDDEGFDYPEA